MRVSFKFTWDYAHGFDVLAETGNFFDGNPGDPGCSSGSAVIILFHDHFLLGQFFQRYARKDPQVSFVLGTHMVELQAMIRWGLREISFELNDYRQT